MFHATFVADACSDMMMWSGKSAAKTFFARFFEKKKKDPDPADVPSARRVGRILLSVSYNNTENSLKKYILDIFCK